MNTYVNLEVQFFQKIILKAVGIGMHTMLPLNIILSN